MDINDFLNPGDYREFCEKPFNYGGYSMATNGWCLLLIDENAEYAENPALKNSEMLDKFIKDIKSLKFTPLPKIQLPLKTECDYCKGTGKSVKVTCPECDGDGEVDAETDYNTYYGLECKTCEGEGHDLSIETDTECEECNGDGKTFESTDSVNVLGININPKIASIVMAEKEVSACASDDGHTLYIKTPSQAAVVMGINK